MEDTLDESIDSSGGAGTRIACCVITESDVTSAKNDDVSVESKEGGSSEEGKNNEESMFKKYLKKFVALFKKHQHE